jgi:uncharacterized protein YgiM (DUF1202 family)
LTILLLSLWVGTAAQAQTSTTTPALAQGTVLYNTDLRAGPGAAHAIVGQVRAGQMISITATSQDGHWIQVDDNTWIAAFLVERKGQGGTVEPNGQSVAATATPTASRRLVATATAALSATNRVTVTPSLRSLFATTMPTATSSISLPTVAATGRATAGRGTTGSGTLTNSAALRNANLRAGPGTIYAVVGGVRANEVLDLRGQSGDGTWLQLRDGSWIAAFLVEPSAPALPTVAPAIIAALPTAVPTATPTPQPLVSTTENPPLAESAPERTTVESNEAVNTGSTTFVVTRRRLWNPWENGGSTDGPSVHCGQGRNLVVNVLDENGNRLNGVAVQAEYGAKEIHVTGAQGKGDGIAEFVLGGGQDVKVVRDADGSPVSSEAATGLSTDPRGIDQASLISAGYCQDDESCRTFANNLSCIGHYSWTVTFERRR